MALDIALGGTGENEQNNSTLLNEYLTTWGGSYGGLSYLGALYNQGSYAYYWSQTESNATGGYNLRLYSNGNIYPKNINFKNTGFALRCIRDVKKVNPTNPTTIYDSIDKYMKIK